MNQENFDQDDDRALWNTDETVQHIPRVLVIEDTPEIGEIIKATLERVKVLVFLETHGANALAAYDRVRPDIVLLDIGLPDMNGWKVLDMIKETKKMYKRPRVVVITAFGDPANRLMGKLQDVDNYLVKPFTPAELRQIVSDLLPK
jgi:two-component system response regulator AdeR